MNSTTHSCLSVFRTFSLSVALLTSALLGVHAADSGVVDLPACEAVSPGQLQGLSLGIVQPHASEPLVAYAAKLTLADPTLNICSESWRSVLPRWVPWASELERGHGFLIFALAFVLVVTVLWRFTPRQWWRRTTLLGALGVGLGTWVVGVGLLALFHLAGGQRLLYGTVVSMRLPQQAAPQWLNVAGARELESVLAKGGALRPAVAAVPSPAPAQPVVPAPAASLPAPVGAAAPLASDASANPSALKPSGAYRVAHRLNLRQGPGVQNPHIITLARGDSVQFDGASQGDWWRIRTQAGQVGWASSLWLRRPVEGLPPAPSTATPRS